MWDGQKIQENCGQARSDLLSQVLVEFTKLWVRGLFFFINDLIQSLRFYLNSAQHLKGGEHGDRVPDHLGPVGSLFHLWDLFLSRSQLPKKTWNRLEFFSKTSNSKLNREWESWQATNSFSLTAAFVLTATTQLSDGGSRNLLQPWLVSMLRDLPVHSLCDLISQFSKGFIR